MWESELETPDTLPGDRRFDLGNSASYVYSIALEVERRLAHNQLHCVSGVLSGLTGEQLLCMAACSPQHVSEYLRNNGVGGVMCLCVVVCSLPVYASPFIF